MPFGILILDFSNVVSACFSHMLHYCHTLQVESLLDHLLEAICLGGGGVRATDLRISAVSAPYTRILRRTRPCTAVG